MGLYQKIEDDMKGALRAHNTVTLSVLRMLISAVKVAEIDRKVAHLDDAQIVQIIQKQVKQHKESIEQFTKGNRADLVDAEKNELRVLESYMPQQLTDAELTALIEQAIRETGAAKKSDTGKVMKAVMEKARGRADGKRINQIVATRLT